MSSLVTIVIIAIPSPPRLLLGTRAPANNDIRDYDMPLC